MNTFAPVVFIDDDKDDLQILVEAMAATGAKNKVICFDDSIKAMAYLNEKKNRPFFILCDINMPKIDGFELRRSIIDDVTLLLSSTPFMFLSTANAPEIINTGYSLNIQGYFTKPSNFDGVVTMLKNIISYWSGAKSPIPI